jgi:hypothetical protein
MSEHDKANSQEDQPGTPATPAENRTPWEAPKLEFVEPRLVKHGEMKRITAGFIGTFVPED